MKQELRASLLRGLLTLACFTVIAVAFLVGLRLGSDGNGEPSSGAPATADVEEVYTCSMHPQVRSQKPGRCPLCAMELVPVSSLSGGEEAPGPRSLVLTEQAARLAEIRTAPVRRAYPRKTVRLIGEVDFDETRLATISAYFPGRLDRLFVDATGIPVREGDHLAEIYSADLLTAQEELRQSRRALDEQRRASETMRVLSEATLEAAREKLRLWGLTDQQVDEIAGSDDPLERITIYSPISGIVIERHATQGQYVELGEAIYTVADLDRVWIVLQAFESQLPWIHYGQQVAFETDAHPGREFVGRISFIDPVLSPDTRTAQVRVAVDNTEGALKPGMFVRTRVTVKVGADGAMVDDELSGRWICPMHPEVIKSHRGSCDVCGMDLVAAEEMGFHRHASGKGAPLVIPASAPLITGTRAVVYVRDPESENPRFEGREVVLGTRAGDQVVVRSGLAEGELVVVRGAFKIDSAMQIEAKASMMSQPAPPRASTGAGGASATPARPSPTRAELQNVEGTVQAYLRAAEALAADELSGFIDAAAAAYDRQHLETLDISAARQLFLEWSQALISHAESTPIEAANDLVVAYCPMAFDDSGAEWVQRGNQIRNPYFGASMLMCGSVRRPLGSPTP